ncbi:hypothetical protein GCM10011579_062110 [Streptomyces albiflavescens]|uniref:Integral membrane protein n=1 Tax=Streptomyces albiflavescens TaxID=1623582 RepID=A0A917Y9M7_9ACTN|nr:hypothetical protein [Streptomyces albiflavescens]GGN78672.1 hypothetical protein GCM10011579_062110 [Streptomyces albiflavescens]
MSELGSLDHPERPVSPGDWDARSGEWLVAGGGEMDVPAEGMVEGADIAGRAGALSREASDDVRGVRAGAGGAGGSHAGWDGSGGSGGAGGSLAGSGGLGDTGNTGDAGGAGGAARTGGDTRKPAASTASPAPTTSPSSAPASPGRRGAVDPVKALMHRHRELCERAVDPLEIAAGLEAHGVTDRTAVRFRHRDVFSLAEEMYARVARDGEPVPRPETPGRPGARADWAALALVPGALCAAAVVGLRITDGRPRLAVAAVGALAVAFGLRVALRRGPLSTGHRTTVATRAWTCWLIAYALLGNGLLSAGLDGGPDGPWPLATAPVLALALACAPAAWCAHLFAVRASRRLTASRGLEEFAASVQPLLLGVFGLFLCALVGLLALCGAALGEPAAYAGAGALGALLLLARLLTARGFTHAPAVVLAAAGAAEATALATVFAGRLPGCSFLTVPVETVVDAWGAGAVPALVCGAAALVLLIHSTRTLTRASAHATPPGEPL